VVVVMDMLETRRVPLKGRTVELAELSDEDDEMRSGAGTLLC
jgi:hypothetical protein